MPNEALADRLATLVALVWVATAVYAFATGDFTGLTVVTPIMGLAAIYAFRTPLPLPRAYSVPSRELSGGDRDITSTTS